MTTGSQSNLSAPTGTPQMPNLLSGYAVRPSWNVAGADYAVGVPSGTTMQDPLTGVLPAGVTRDDAAHTFTITGNDVVLSGWSFSLEGGWGVQEGNNDTIESNYFKVGANAVDPINTGGKAFAPLSQMMAGDFGNGSHFAQNTSSTAQPQRQTPNLLTRPLH